MLVSGHPSVNGDHSGCVAEAAPNECCPVASEGPSAVIGRGSEHHYETVSDSGANLALVSAICGL